MMQSIVVRVLFSADFGMKFDLCTGPEFMCRIGLVPWSAHEMNFFIR